MSGLGDIKFRTTNKGSECKNTHQLSLPIIIIVTTSKNDSPEYKMQAVEHYYQHDLTQ